MTTQEYYDTVRNHFNKPDAEFGIKPSGECVLWDHTADTRCAVGCAIPREQYQYYMEGYDVAMIQEELPELFGEIPTSFLRYAQALHDEKAMSIYDPGQKDSVYAAALQEFIHELDNLAREWGLKVPA